MHLMHRAVAAREARRRRDPCRLAARQLLVRHQHVQLPLRHIQLDQVANALSQFRLDLDRWPSEEEGIEVLWKRASLEDENDYERWRGPYLTDPVTEDRWGNELQYRFPGEIRGESYFDLISFGPDGEEDTEDDITNHDRLRGEGGEMPEDVDFGATDTGAGAAPGS